MDHVNRGLTLYRENNNKDASGKLDVQFNGLRMEHLKPSMSTGFVKLDFTKKKGCYKIY